MKIVQIQDKHIINKKNLPKWQQKLYDGNGRHTYIMYETTNKSGKQQHKLLATSHYYDPDKVTKIRKKNAILMKFADLSEPTTVTNVRYQKTCAAGNSRLITPTCKLSAKFLRIKKKE